MNSLTFNRYRNFAEKVLILDSGALSFAYQKTYGNLKLCFDVRSGNAYHLCRWKQKYISKVQLYILTLDTNLWRYSTISQRLQHMT